MMIIFQFQPETRHKILVSKWNSPREPVQKEITKSPRSKYVPSQRQSYGESTKTREFLWETVTRNQTRLYYFWRKFQTNFITTATTTKAVTTSNLRIEKRNSIRKCFTFSKPGATEFANDKQNWILRQCKVNFFIWEEMG